MNAKDVLRLTGIVKYCDQIDLTLKRYSDDYNEFQQDCVFQNACCMCIIQIGEMANGLSQQAIESMPLIPWKQIRGMRNVFAHNYGQIDLPATWNTLHSDISELRASVLERLKTESDQ